MKIVYYAGAQPRMSIQRPEALTFDRFVPTPVKNFVFNSLDPDEFREATPANRHEWKPGRRVYLKLERSLLQACIARTVILELQQLYPTCPIVVLTNEHFQHVLPPAVEVVSEYDPKILRDGYRLFNFMRGEGNRFFTPPMMQGIPLDSLARMTCDLYEPGDSHDPKPWPVKVPLQNQVVLIQQGRTFESAWQAGFDYFCKQLTEAGEKLIIIRKYRETEGLTAEMVEQIASAKFILSFADSKLNYLASFMAKPRFFFLNEENGKKHHVFQFMQFPGCQWAAITPKLNLEIAYQKLAPIIAAGLEPKI